jgi:hypothetical protein
MMLIASYCLWAASAPSQRPQARSQSFANLCQLPCDPPRGSFQCNVDKYHDLIVRSVMIRTRTNTNKTSASYPCPLVPWEAAFRPSIAARRSDRDVGACSQWGVVTIMIHDRMHLLRERRGASNGKALKRTPLCHGKVLHSTRCCPPRRAPHWPRHACGRMINQTSKLAWHTGSSDAAHHLLQQRRSRNIHLGDRKPQQRRSLPTGRILESAARRNSSGSLLMCLDASRLPPTSRSTSVERNTRFTMLIKIPRKDTTTVVAAP